MALPTKALSIRQPWAWAIVHAGKDIENRSWWSGFRGRFCIHAAKGLTRDEYEDFLDTAHAISLGHPFPPGLTLPAFNSLPRGGIIGVADMVDCVVSVQTKSPWFFGPHGFVLKNVEPVEFIPVKGALGFFDWRANIIDPQTPARQGVML